MNRRRFGFTPLQRIPAKLAPKLKCTHDDEGVATTLTTPLGNVTQFERDKLGMLIGVTDPLGHKTTLTRDALSRITRITDPLNRTTNFAYTNDGRLASVTMPVIGATKYDYDALGNLIRITDLNGAEWKFAYTPQGRLTSQTDPVGQIVNLTYDARGRLNKIVFADGSTSTLTYDASSNLTRSQFSDGLDLKFAYDTLNRPIEANGVKFAYDAEGRIVNTDNAGAAYGATYDAAGRIKTITYAGGLVVNYTYDAKTGSLTQVSDSLTKTQYDFTYAKDQQLVGITRSNKVNTTLTWDKAGRLTGIKDGNVMDAQYTLDAAGQVTSAKMQLPLDPATALKPTAQTLTFDAASQVSSVGYKYDACGRLVESPLGAFKWDGASRLVGIQSTIASQPSSVALTYNGLGDVTARQDGAQTTRYAYNYALGLAPIAAETDSSAPGKPLRYYVWTPSGTLLYMIDAADGNKVYHYHFDRTGSTVALTDANGAVTDAYAYDPYGKLLAHQGKSAQPFTFVGKWGVRQEGASGALYQMRARYYDATTAQFISREPLWPMIPNPKQLNPYQYATNDPVQLVDLTGTATELLDKLWNHNGEFDEWQEVVEVPSPKKHRPGTVWVGLPPVGGMQQVETETGDYVAKMVEPIKRRGGISLWRAMEIAVERKAQIDALFAKPWQHVETPAIGAYLPQQHLGQRSIAEKEFLRRQLPRKVCILEMYFKSEEFKKLYTEPPQGLYDSASEW